jgi:transposase
MIDSNKTKNFASAIRQGCTYQAGASAIGVSVDTIYSWLRQGRAATRKNDKYLKFLKAVKKAEHERQQYLLAQILEASNKDWKAAAWLLERRDGFRKDAVWKEEPDDDTTKKDQPSTPLELFQSQAEDLEDAMQQAKQAQSWQAYAALQRQYITVLDSIRSIEAEEGAIDSLDSASDEILKVETVNAIINLPPVLRQNIIEELSRFSNVIPMKQK